MTYQNKQIKWLLNKEKQQVLKIRNNLIVTIQDDMENFNIKNIFQEINNADKINKNSGGMINKALYIVLIFVILLILLSWIMP